jgi:hypothetical protein
MLRATVLQSLDAIDPSVWDAAGNDPLSRHGVLTALAAARLPGVQMWYGLLQNESGAVRACLPFACLPIDGARLTHGLFHSSIVGIRHLAPGFFRTSVMICGTPLSVANPPLRLAVDSEAKEVYREAAGLLRELAQEAGAPWRAFKEFAEHTELVSDSLAREGWLLAPSELTWHLNLRWPSFAAYLGSLRSHYRYKIKKSAARLKARDILVDVVPLAEGYNPTLHRLYEAVVDRAAICLERLTCEFFQQLGCNYPAQTHLLRFRRQGQVVGWVALLRDGDHLYDLFHGLDYAENEVADLYFNQLAAVVRQGITSGARWLHLGQSTGQAKTRFGATSATRWIALQHRVRPVNGLLACGHRVLFPDPPKIHRRVFRPS